MSVSLNHIKKEHKVFIKTYGGKKPLWKYYIRSFLDILGFSQPVEYYNIKKRKQFEYETLILWAKYSLNVPNILKNTNNQLHLSQIEGQTINQILLLNDNLPLNILQILFQDLNDRHQLAFCNNEPKLCHIDSNLNNILYSEGTIYHVDFEMGRLYENIEKWAEREISMLLMSLLKFQTPDNRLLITKLFLKVYEHKKIIYQLINHKLKNPFSKLQKIKKKRKYTYFQLVFELNKNLMECSNEN